MFLGLENKMSSNQNRFEHSEVLGIAIKMIGSVLRPFVADKELRAMMDEVDRADPRAFYPVTTLISLFQLAAKNQLLERLAKNLAVSSLPALMKMNHIQTPIDVIETLVEGFPSHHRDFVGDKSIREIGPDEVEIIDTSYVPCDYTIPLYKKTLEGFGAKQVVVDHPKEQCQKAGDAACRILFKWTQSDLLRLRRKEKG